MNNINQNNKKEIINCLICGNNNYTPVRGNDIVKCNNCGNVYLRERKSKEVMEQYYSEVYAVNNPSAAAPVRLPVSVEIIDIEEEYIYSQRKWILENIQNKYITNLNGKYVIDIGCGWGGFLYNAKKLGLNTTGYEFNNPNVNFANSKLNLNVKQMQFDEDKSIKENSIDIIVMNHVLEHVPNPLESLKKIHNSLIDGSIFFCMVPNFNSFLSEGLQEHWHWIEREDHYTHFTPDIFRKILPELGFEILELFTSTGDYDINVLNAVLKHIYPNLEISKYNQIIDEINKMEKGEQINLFARKKDKQNLKTNENRKKLLWNRSDSIGDNIISAGMLEFIAKKYIDFDIYVICQEHIKEIYQNSPFVKEIIGYNRYELYNNQNYQTFLWSNLRTYQFNLVINSVFSRDLISDYISLNIGAKETIAFDGDNSNIQDSQRLLYNNHYSHIIPCENKTKNELLRNLEFLKGIGVDKNEIHPTLWLTEEDEIFAQNFFKANNLKLENTICIFPSAQYKVRLYKNFPKILESFNDFNIIILGGKDSIEIAKSIEEAFSGNIINLTGKISLLKSAAIIKYSALIISTESAGSHIASAVGTKSVVIVGGGHFSRFMPYNNITSIVCLPLECYSCNWNCKFSDSHCINGIKPEVIVEAIFDSLQTDSKNPKIFIQGKTIRRNFDNPQWEISEIFKTLENIDYQIVEE